MGRSSRILGDIPRYGSCHEGLCSVKSFGVIFLPASSSATRMPAAVSFLAAQPPVAPEPTTMASKGSLGETICSIKRSISRGHVGQAFVHVVRILCADREPEYQHDRRQAELQSIPGRGR